MARMVRSEVTRAKQLADTATRNIQLRCMSTSSQHAGVPFFVIYTMVSKYILLKLHSQFSTLRIYKGDYGWAFIIKLSPPNFETTSVFACLARILNLNKENTLYSSHAKTKEL